MLVHAYRISPDKNPIPIERALASIWGDPNRLLTHFRDYQIRVEQSRTDPNGLWVALDVTREYKRDVGKTTMGAPSVPIALNQGEDFTNFTAILYHSASSTLFVESNIAGARIGSLNSYLDAFSGNPPTSGYLIQVIERNGSPGVIIKNSHIRKIHLSANLVRLHKAGLFSGSLVGTIRETLNRFRNSAHVERVNLALSCRPKAPNQKKGTPGLAGLDSEEIADIVEFVEDAMQRDPRAIKAEFYNAVGANITDMVLSLCGQKWVHSVNLAPAPAGVRYPFDERLRVLQTALAQARAEGIVI